MYTQDKIPVNFDQIPSREVALEWKHLQPIVDEMLPKGSCDVKILIGHNCHLAFKPLKLLYAQDDEDPFAVKNYLGWSVFGATTVCEEEEEEEEEEEDSTESFSSHSIVAKETVGLKGENKSVLFVVNTSRVKEVINPNEVLKVLESDFYRETGDREETDVPQRQKNSSISSMKGYPCERTHTKKCLSRSTIHIQ